MPSQDLKIPDHFINRTAEREIFEQLLQLKEDARFLAIEDKEGTGKSTLLKMLRYQTFFLYQKPVSIISLEEPTINSPFIFIERLRKGFGTRGKFTNFDALNQARVNKISSRFAPSPATISGTVDARGVVISGSGHEFAGVKVNASGTVVVNPNDWSLEQEELAREECIKGFRADLQSSNEAIVVLLDSYERCSLDLAGWILEEFLLSFCFNAENRPARLLLVLAGRELPNFKAMLDQLKYEQFIRSKELSMWEEEHVKAFLKVHGYSDLSDEDVEYVWVKVKKGRTIREALTLADFIRFNRL